MKKIAIQTGTRADFFLLENLIELCQNDIEVELHLIVTGEHLIEESGFVSSKTKALNLANVHYCDILLASDTKEGMAKSFALGVLSISNVLETVNPDFIVILGDRYEAFAAGSAAMFLGVPVAHIHGGELTLGLIDDPIRHSLSKISSKHFVSHTTHKNRLLRMGEQRHAVHVVGGFGVDLVRRSTILSSRELNLELDILLPEEYFVITFHPLTLDQSTPRDQTEALFRALHELPSSMGLVFTGSNIDAGGKFINSAIKNFVASRNNSWHFSSLGARLYLSLVANSKGVVGNSSSALLEAPYLGVPSLNIGIRQGGRLQGASVLNVDANLQEILAGLSALQHLNLDSLSSESVRIFGEGGASERTFQILKNWAPERNSSKIFFDGET